MLNPSPFPVAGGSVLMPSTRATLRPIVFDVGGTIFPFAEFITSGTVSREDLIEIFLIGPGQDAYAHIDPDQVRLTVRTCSGGGGGSVATTTGYGGFPGIVAERSFMLTDLPAMTTIPFVVGAGGAAGTSGGDTTFGAPGDPWLVHSFRGYRGGPVDADETSHWFLMSSSGHRMPDAVAVTSHTWEGSRSSNPFGPGKGGSASSTKNLRGGHASTMFPNALVLGGETSGTDGLDAIARQWDSYGSGGAGAPVTNGQGGRGGSPGGGGGASRAAAPAWNKGNGGHGSIRIKAEYWEVF